MDNLHWLSVTLLLFAAAMISVSGQSGFSVEPSSKQVIEGSSVTLNCIIIADSSGENYVQWIKGSKAVSSNYTINNQRLETNFQVSEPSRYRIVGDFSRGEFNLRIENTIKSQDDDEYKCIVMSKYGPLSISDEVRLSVASPSVDQYPLCSPTILKPRYEEGERIVTGCVFRHAVPAPELRWRYVDRVFPGNRVYDSLPDIRQEWVLTHLDDGAVFTCEAVGSTFRQSQTCEIGPLTVLYRPRVTVEPSGYSVLTGSTIVFTCTASSNPAPSAYVWEINGKVVIESSNKYSFSDNGKFFTIKDVSTDENGISVTCLAANNIGLGVPDNPATVQVFVSESEKEKNSQIKTVAPTASPEDVEQGMADPKTLAIIVVAAAAGLAVIFSIIVLICFRKTISKCCQDGPSGICWRTKKPAEVNTENKFSNIAELSTMIALQHKLEQFEGSKDAERDTEPVYETPYTPEITIV